RDAGEVVLGNFTLGKKDLDVREHSPENVSGKDFEGGVLYIKTDQSRELVKESFMKELMRKVQLLRKEAGLDVEENVKLRVDAKEDVRDLLNEWKGDLETETGSVDIEFGNVSGDTKEVTYNGMEAEISIEPL
ncbi:MAG: DUF5915 domain-containing protein, partial [Candidatus Aenigmatarchaeota archaeon]